MKVKEVMHKGVDWVDPGTSITELAKLMCDRDIGSIPIGQNDRLIGMVTDRDIVCQGLVRDCCDFEAFGKRVGQNVPNAAGAHSRRLSRDFGSGGAFSLQSDPNIYWLDEGITGSEIGATIKCAQDRPLAPP